MWLDELRNEITTKRATLAPYVSAVRALRKTVLNLRELCVLPKGHRCPDVSKGPTPNEPWRYNYSKDTRMSRPEQGNSNNASH